MSLCALSVIGLTAIAPVYSGVSWLYTLLVIVALREARGWQVVIVFPWVWRFPLLS